jgi:hypothetical protein
MVGAVLAARGAALTTDFHLAALAGAGACLLAALISYCLVGRDTGVVAAGI